MRGSRTVFQLAWNSCGRGALYSARNETLRSSSRQIPLIPNYLHCARPISTVPRQTTSSTILLGLNVSRSSLKRPSTLATSLLSVRSGPYRELSQSSGKDQEAVARPTADDNSAANPKQNVEEEDEETRTFGRSDRAEQAAKLNLSARLSKDGGGSQQTGREEIWRLIKIARPEVKTLSLAVGLLLISSSITMCIPYSIGKILDIATNEEKAKELLFGFSLTTFYLALGGVLTIGAFANYGRVVLLRIVGERIVTKLRTRLYRNTFVQDAEFFDANRVGDLISRLGSDTIIVGKSITQNVSDGLRSFISGAAGFTLMAYTSLKLTGVLAFMFPPVAIGAFFYGRVIRNLSRKIQQNLGTLTKIGEERLGNVRTSQAFSGEAQEVGRYSHQVRKIFDLGRKEAFISATFFGASGWAGNMTILALLYVGGGMVHSGAISVGELTSFLMYTAYAGGSLFGLSGFYSELMKGVGAASRLFELQDRRPTISPTAGDPVPNLNGPIKFEHVTFSYPTRPAVEIFHDLTFTIEQGTNVAVVAPSGAGKSTVASLLMRFYSPNQGKITVNGKDISTMNAKQLRRRIGYVGQEPVLFSGTIAENIAYGRPSASRSEILSAARRANCTFLADFPAGLETEVGARGTQLSGGQKQRIAIARALLKDPDILILDEATSALDAESETLVNQALSKLLQGHNTTLSIAHRLSTIKRSDTIIVIGNDGRIAEVGDYDTLSANPEGAFSKLMEWQFSGGEGQASKMAPRAGEHKDGEVHEEDEHEEVTVPADQARDGRLQK